MVIDWRKVYRDGKDINALKSQLVPIEYAINSLLHPLDTTYEITVKYKDSEGRTAAKAAGSIADATIFKNLNSE